MRRRWLGTELRRLREAADLTLDQAAANWESGKSRISKIELGQLNITQFELAAWLDYYDVTDQQYRNELLRLHKQVNRRGWWHTYSDVLPSWFETYVEVEDAANELTIFDSQFVPGLLQTPDYAQALARTSIVSPPPEVAERRVELRLNRQHKVLTRPTPPRLWVVVGEAALRQRVGTPEVMRAQLHHLTHLIQTQPTVLSLQVLPFHLSTAAWTRETFTLLSFAEAIYPDVVYIEYRTGSLLIEDEREVDEYKLVSDHLKVEALGTAESSTLIDQIAEELAPH